MTLFPTRKVSLALLAVAALFGVTSSYAHAPNILITPCPMGGPTPPDSCATVPTTTTFTTSIASGAFVPVPIPFGPHDMRVVVAVVPNDLDAEGSNEHGVGAIDLIVIPATLNMTRASWTGINGKGQVIDAQNEILSIGETIMEANQSGTISLQYGGPTGGGHNLNVVNSGASPRTVSIRWIH